MKNLEEILHHYTRGDKPLNETNQALKELDCGLQLDPTRNLFSAQELAETRVGETPDEANGWGLMDHGVGCMEKVHVVDGLCVHRRPALPPAGRCADGGKLKWSC